MCPRKNFHSTTIRCCTTSVWSSLVATEFGKGISMCHFKYLRLLTEKQYIPPSDGISTSFATRSVSFLQNTPLGFHMSANSGSGLGKSQDSLSHRAYKPNIIWWFSRAHDISIFTRKSKMARFKLNLYIFCALEIAIACKLADVEIVST